MRAIRLTFLVGALIAAWGQQSNKPEKTDTEIRQEIIKESIASYRGNCPCPYNVDRAGRRCGARSAYSRPGGASPICYDKDVTQKMVDDYRNRRSTSRDFSPARAATPPGRPSALRESPPRFGSPQPLPASEGT